MRIAFDIGNVLVQVDFEDFFTKFRRIGTKTDPFEFLCDLQAQQDIGVVTLPIAFRNRFGQIPESQMEELMRAWDESIKPNKEMLDFVDRLKKEGAKVAILSNMGSAHADYIRAEYPRIFDGCKLHLSYEVGVRKPNKLYYQSFLMQYPNFEGCIFLDDRPENLEAAKKFGMNVQRFELNKFTKLSSNERKDILSSIRGKVYNQMLHGTTNCRRH